MNTEEGRQSAEKSRGLDAAGGQRRVHETFLLTWINEVLRLFEQNPSKPPWSGARPLSREKLEAALTLLLWGSYRLPKLFHVAGSSKRSYEVLRKWRTERAFRRLVDWLAEQFLTGFFRDYQAEIGVVYQGFERTTKDSTSRKYEALAIRELARLLTYANDGWGKILYQMAFERLRELIRKEKDPRAVGHLYLLLLVCHFRWPKKLVIDPKDGKKYHEGFHKFIQQLLWDWSEEHAFGSAATAKMYAEALGAYMLLLHSKLTGPIFKHDVELGDLALVSPAEMWELMGWPKKA